MPRNDFATLFERMQADYRDGNYAAALELASQGFERFPEQRALLTYWRITMCARLGQEEDSLALLEQALADGLWYSETLLRRSPSLAALQGQEEFEELVALNRDIQEKDKEHAYPMIILRTQGRCRKGGRPCPLLLALHDHASNAQEATPFWQAAASAGWLTAVLQSSQAMWKGAYVWDDREAAAQEIQEHYYRLQNQYAVDTDRTVIAGNSQGGEVAIWLALSDEIPARGFIAINPDISILDNLEEWASWLQQGRERRVRGYLIIGKEATTTLQENARLLDGRLEKSGIACKLEQIPGAGGEYAPPYAEALRRGLEFLDL
jgi:predicted esterase